MNALFNVRRGAGDQPSSKSAAIVVGFAYFAIVAVADTITPVLISFIPLYLCGIAFLGWRAGLRSALVAAFGAGIVTTIQDWDFAQQQPAHGLIASINAVCTLAAFAGTALITARFGRLNHDLNRLVTERTAAYQNESEGHKATAAKLAETNERFSQVINNIAEVFWLLELKERRVVYASPGYERIWGEPVEALYSDAEAWLKMLHPDDLAAIGSRYVKEQQSGTYDVEYRIVRRDGEVRWIHDRAFPVRNVSGEIYRIAGIAQDITDRKRTEQVLNVQSQVLENMAEAAVMVDNAGLIALTNPAANALLGCSPGELIGKPLHSVTAMDREEFESAFRQNSIEIAAGKTLTREYPARRKDGTSVLLELRLSGFLVNSRRFFILVGQDISERKRAQQAVLQQEQLYRTLFELCPDGILLESSQGEILDVNNVICQSLGYTRAELVGKDVRGLAAEESRPLIESNLAELRVGKALEQEVWNLHKDGSRRLMRLNEKPIALPDGRQGIMVVARDITERKREELTRETLLSLGARLSMTRTPIAAAEAIFDSANQLLEWDSAALDLYHPESDRMEHVVNYDIVDGRRQQVPSVRAFLPPTPRMRRVMQSGPELVLRPRDGLSDPSSVLFGDASRRSASIMAVPLRRNQQRIGVLSIHRYAFNAYTEADLQTLQALADHCGAALDRIRAETALRESEERYRSVVEDQTEIISRFTPDGRLLFVNEAYCRFFGKRMEDVVGKAWQPQAAPDEVARVQAMLNTLSPSHPVVVIENTVFSRGGRRHWMQFANRALFDSDGRLREIQSVGRDLTERKRAEEALRASESTLSAVFRILPIGISIVSEEGKIRDLNPALCKALNVSPEALRAGENLHWKLFSADRKPLPVANIPSTRAIREQREFLDVEIEIQKPDGHRLWVSVNTAPLPGIGAVVATVDITERKRAEFLLRAQRDLAAGMSATSSLGIATQQFLDLLLEVEGIEIGSVLLFDPLSGALDLSVHRDTLPAAPEPPALLGHDETRALLKGEPLYLSQEQIQAAGPRPGAPSDINAIALLPLSHAGIALGAVKLCSRSQTRINDAVRGILETLAGDAAGAIARFRAEEALHRSEARLRTFVSAAPVLLFACDRDGVITLEDGAALRALGIKPGARVGKSAFEVFARVPLFLNNLRRALHGEEFNSIVELEGCAFDCGYAPVRDRTGQIMGFNCVGTNITERYRLERQILEISDREQARIGQDLHDGLCQQLVTLAFDANSLHTNLARHKHREAARADRIARELDDAISEARHLARGLFPVRLESEGLAPALQELAATTKKRFAVDCAFHGDGHPVVKNSAVATHLYRIAQEAITNAIRHGKATAVAILLRSLNGELELRVEDNGRGLAAGESTSALGMGMHIMDYRSRAVFGTLRILPTDGRGVTISCCVPQP